MSRNGAGLFTLDPRYLVSEGDTILPSQHNPVLEDLQTDANTPRPIVAGGTGASTATTARTNLSVYSIADVDAGFTPKVATRTALKALDTATTKAVVLTEASRQKLFMWMTGDFTDSVAGDPSELAYIPADGIDPALGCWVAVTGAGASIVPVIQGGTGANDAATALDNLGGMASATYDPNSVAGDAFDMANMVEATDAKVMTAAERTKLAGIPYVVTPRQFGAVGDGVTDDTAAINAALDFIRTNVDEPAILGRRYTLDGAGYLYRIDGSLDATGFTLGRSWGICNLLLDAHCAGKVALDLTGSQYGAFKNIRIWGDATDTPYSGIQFAPEDIDGVNSMLASNHQMDSVTTDGYFLNSGYHNYAAEGIKHTRCLFWNRRTADANGESWAAIIDGGGYKTAISDFKTISTGRKSFTLGDYDLCSFQKPFGVSGPTIFLQDPGNIRFGHCYASNGSGSIIEWRLTSAFSPFSVHMDFQVETTTTEVFCTFTSDGVGARTIEGLHCQFGNVMTTDQMFVVDADITSLTIKPFTVYIPHWHGGSSSGPTNGIFGVDKTRVTIRDGHVHVPLYANFGDATTYAAYQGSVHGGDGNYQTFGTGQFDKVTAYGAVPNFQLRQSDSGYNFQMTANGLSAILAADTDQNGTYDTNVIAFSTGVYHPSATGGNKGANTINFGAVYDDNVLLTDYVFDKWLGIQKLYSPRVQEKADALDTSMFDPAEYSKFMKEHGRLWGMPDLNDTLDGVVKEHSLGAMIQKLWQTVEVQAIHNAELLERLEKLEIGTAN